MTGIDSPRSQEAELSADFVALREKGLQDHAHVVAEVHPQDDPADEPVWAVVQQGHTIRRQPARSPAAATVAMNMG